MTRDEQKASQLYHLLNEVGTALVDADSTIAKQARQIDALTAEVQQRKSAQVVNAAKAAKLASCLVRIGYCAEQDMDKVASNLSTDPVETLIPLFNFSVGQIDGKGIQSSLVDTEQDQPFC